MRILKIDTQSGARHSITIKCRVHTKTTIEQVLPYLDFSSCVIAIDGYGTYKKCGICRRYVKILLHEVSDAAYCLNCPRSRYSTQSFPSVVCLVLNSTDFEIRSQPEDIDEIDINTTSEVLWFTPQRVIWYRHCQYCGEAWTKREVCDTCQEITTPCCHCANYTHRNDAYYDRNGSALCPSCVDTYSVCENCGNWTNYGDLCEDCEEEESSQFIHQHGYKPRPLFHPQNNNDNSLFLGIELETDKYREDIDIVAENLLQHSQDESLFYLAEDGSLDNGIEIITHPCTLDYHKVDFPWAKLIEIVREGGGLSHNTNTCGLHIHFNMQYLGDRDSKENDFNLLKLLYIFEKFWDKLVTFSRRDSSQLHWCGKYSKLKGKESEDIATVKEYKCGLSGKHVALNILNHSTVEVRLFRGTLKLSTFYASLEFVDFLVNFIKNHNARYIYKLTWEQLMENTSKKEKQYPYLIPYLKEKQLCA